MDEERLTAAQAFAQRLLRGRRYVSYWLGSVRGNPKNGRTVFSKRVMAQMRSSVRVRTYKPTP